jgi:hypothetical protein
MAAYPVPLVADLCTVYVVAALPELACQLNVIVLLDVTAALSWVGTVVCVVAFASLEGDEFPALLLAVTT